jgi:hypothetical protein
VARKQRSTLAQTVLPVLGGLAFIAALGAGLWGAAWWLNQGNAEVRIGSQFFNTLFYEREAKLIATRGPQLYPGLIGADKGYLFIHHVDEDPIKGWVAFSAVAEGQPINCSVIWKPIERVFEDPCNKRQYPPNGDGLRQFDAIADTNSGRLVVDLRSSPPTT